MRIEGVAASLTRILSSVLPLLVSCLMARTNLMACLSSTFLMLSLETGGEGRREGGQDREREGGRDGGRKAKRLIT